MSAQTIIYVQISVATVKCFNVDYVCTVLQLSYSPNLGELSQNGSQNIFHLFPSQMDPTVIAAVLNFHGWRRAAVLTEQNRQIAVSGRWKHFVL